VPHIVPSDVRDAITNLFPAVKTGGQLELALGHERQIAIVVALVDEIPRELLTLEPAEYAKLVSAQAYLRAAVESFQLKGTSAESVTKIPGMGPLSPVTHIYHALTKCPDVAPPPKHDDFRFVDDGSLRDDLARDTSSVVAAARDGQWKAATVLGGSVVVALLYWSLSRMDADAVKEAARQVVARNELRKTPPPKLVDWVLSQYIPVAVEMELISKRTVGLCNAAREFRNLIHPGAAERTAAACDNGTAYAALAAVYAVSNDLDKALSQRSSKNEAAP